jgi:hypothetical protein
MGISESMLAQLASSSNPRGGGFQAEDKKSSRSP